MNRVKSVSVWIVLMLAVAAMTLGYSSTATAQKAATKARKPRLPNYYAKVVTDEQRTEINTIQEEYAPQIAKLRAELDSLLEERDAAVEKVLTAEQRKEVAKLRAEAAARRQSRSSAASEAEEKPTKSRTKKAA